MAFGRNSDKPVFVRRTGVGTAKVVAVNPTTKEINDIFGRELFNEEQKYSREVEYNGKKYKEMDVTFLLKFDPTIPDNNGYDNLHFLTFRLRNQAVSNADETKFQVIDEFGRTAWVSAEELKNKDIPVYKNGPARISKNYRNCYRSEENLINFISALRATPSIDVWNKTTHMWETNSREDPENCKKEITIDDLKKIFSGDMTPIRDCWDDCKDNYVKVLLGVRTGNDGKKYSVIFDSFFLSQFQKSTTALISKLADEVARGRYSDTVFKVGPLTDVESVTPDDLSKPATVSTASKPAFDPLGDLPF